jgi:hypothetical protein
MIFHSFFKNSALVLFLFQGQISIGQYNLVKNGGFEEPKEVSLSISAWDSNGGQPYYLADGWKSVLGSCDYYCDSVEFFSSMEGNPILYDFQMLYRIYPDITNSYCPPLYENNVDLPYVGNNFAGIVLASRVNFQSYNYYSELLQGEFIQPLKNNKEYRLSFWYKFNVGFNTQSLNNVNIVLTNDVVLGPQNDIVGCQYTPGNTERANFFNLLSTHQKYRAQLQPSIAFNNWAYCELFFQARGGERYFYINVPDGEVEHCNEFAGQYEPSPAYPEYDTCLCLNQSYIYLDEFSCVEAPSFPNIVTLDTDTLNSSFHSTDVTWPCDIEIYNRWGVHVGDITPLWPYYTPMESGTYFYAGSCGSSSRHGYFEVIEK